MDLRFEPALSTVVQARGSRAEPPPAEGPLSSELLERMQHFGRELEKTSLVFWFMMQIAMFFGFMTSYPVNAWLLRRGIKEAM